MCLWRRFAEHQRRWAWVAFISTGTEIVAGKTTAFADVFAANFNLGLVAHRLSFDTGNIEAKGASFGATISADGAWVAFLSDAPNSAPPDVRHSRR